MTLTITTHNYRVTFTLLGLKFEYLSIIFDLIEINNFCQYTYYGNTSSLKWVGLNCHACKIILHKKCFVRTLF